MCSRRAPYDVVATSRWEDIDLGETSRPYRNYFEPEARARQAERLDPDLDVDRLHPVTIRTPEGSWGTLFLDNSGEVVLASTYPLVWPFSEGLAVVGTAVTDDRNMHIIDYGYIDRTGQLAIDPVYDSARRFSDGLAAVQQDNRWGYIDREGRVVIPLRYKIAEEFRDGLARVWPEHDLVQYIDRSGNVRFEAQEGNVGPFSEGLLFAFDPPLLQDGIGVSSYGWGYMDRNFEYVFRVDADRFFRGQEFHDDRAAVEIARGGTSGWGFLSREGDVAIEGPFAQVDHFSEGLAAVQLSNELLPGWGYIDTAGEVVIEPRFLQATPFSEGLAAVLVPLDDLEEQPGDAPPHPNSGSTRNVPRCRWGYIDRQGRMAIEPNFDRAMPFEDGLAYVHENALLDGYIDKTGSYVWKLTEPKLGD